MNQIKTTIATLLIGLCLFSCHTTPKNSAQVSNGQNPPVAQPAGPIHLVLPDLIQNKKPVFLSQLAESVEYVPLETTTKFMIGDKGVHVKPCGDYLFVAEHGKPIGVFNRSGKFLRTIGNIGKGPGEYNFDFTFWPEEKSQQIYLWNADTGTIMVFSFEGSFIKDIKPEIKPMAFAPLGNGKFLTWTFMQKEQEGKYYRMVVHDDSGTTIQRLFEPKIKYDFSKGVSIMTPLLTPTFDGFLFNSWKTDTIFKGKSDNTFHPAITWEMGKLNLPDDILQDYARFQREGANYLVDFNAFESKTQWLCRYEYKNRHEMAVYQKSQQDFFVVANPDTAQNGVCNDIDGGPSFFPSWDNENGEVFVKLIHAIDLIDYPKSSVPGNPPVKNPAAEASFRSMVAGLTENSNPVVMLVKMH